MARLLLVSLDRLGDLVMTLPALEHVRRSFPEAHVSFLATRYAGGLLEGHPAVDRLFRVERRGDSVRRFLRFRGFLRAWGRTPPDRLVLFREGHDGRTLVRRFAGSRIDSVNALPDDVRGTLHTARLRSAVAERVCGRPVPADAERPALALPEAARAAARAILAARGVEPGRAVALHPGTNRYVRQRGIGPRAPKPPSPKLWPPRHWIALGRALVARGVTPVLTGSGGEVAVCAELAREIGPGAVSAAGEHPVLELAALYAETRGLVVADTGPGHLAAAAGAPVVSLFGPTSPFRFAPLADPERLRVLWRPDGCPLCKEGRSREGGHTCMDDLGPDAVMGALEALARV